MFAVLRGVHYYVNYYSKRDWSAEYKAYIARKRHARQKEYFKKEKEVKEKMSMIDAAQTEQNPEGVETGQGEHWRLEG